MFKDEDDMIAISGWVCLSIIVAFGIGMFLGFKNEQADAVKAGVAHYVADEQGNSKFEYNK